MIKDKGRRKSRKGLVAMQKARKLILAVKFVQSYIEKGTDVMEAIQIASRFYHVSIADIREKVQKAINAGSQRNSRIWGPDELAKHFGFSVHWVYKITKKTSIDPPPRCTGLGRLRFDTESKEFQEWLTRQTNSVSPIDSQGN